MSYKEIYIPFTDLMFNRRAITAISFDDSCWFCNSHPKDDDGYCRIHFHGIDTRVHRVVYMLLNGDIPEGMVVRHICDHPDCINPEHLILGTQADNAKDRKMHGNYLSGESVSTSKLKESEVIEILNNLSNTIQEIALQYHVSHSTIRDIKNGRSWVNISNRLIHNAQHKTKVNRTSNKSSVKNPNTKRMKKKRKES